MRVDKPWGYYEDIFRDKKVVFKKIVVTPGQTLSTQKHDKRGEFWYCVSGDGIFEISMTWTRRAVPGTIMNISHGTVHRMVNTGETDLVVYETQYGECDENDIIRYEDQYGRT